MNRRAILKAALAPVAAPLAVLVPVEAPLVSFTSSVTNYAVAPLVVSVNGWSDWGDYNGKVFQGILASVRLPEAAINR